VALQRVGDLTADRALGADAAVESEQAHRDLLSRSALAMFCLTDDRSNRQYARAHSA
jgi:hypothetical protein